MVSTQPHYASYQQSFGGGGSYQMSGGYEPPPWSQPIGAESQFYGGDHHHSYPTHQDTYRSPASHHAGPPYISTGTPRYGPVPGQQRMSGGQHQHQSSHGGHHHGSHGGHHGQPQQQQQQGAAPILKLGGRAPTPTQKGGYPFRRWPMEQLRKTDGIIRLQSGTNKFDSQRGMTGFGTPRNTKTSVRVTNPDLITDFPAEASNEMRIGHFTVGQLRSTEGIVPSQYGTNRFDSQKGMTGFGAPRDVSGRHLHRLQDEMAMYGEYGEGFY